MARHSLNRVGESSEAGGGPPAGAGLSCTYYDSSLGGEAA